MINVSFNDLTLSKELPPPRTAPRSDTASAFDKLMDEAGNRQDAPKEPDRARAAKPREHRPEPARTTTGTDTDRHDADPQPKTTETTESPKADKPSRVVHGADTGRKDIHDAAKQQNSKPSGDGTEQTAAATDDAAAASDKSQPLRDAAATAQAAASATPPAQPNAVVVIDAPPPANATSASAIAATAPAVAATAPAVGTAPPLPQGVSTNVPAAQNIGDTAPTMPSGTASTTQSQASAIAPSVPPSNGDKPSALAVPAAASAEKSTDLPAPGGKFLPDTLFAATMLAQSTPVEAGAVLPQALVPTATPPGDASSAVLPPTTEPASRGGQNTPLSGDPAAAKPAPAKANDQATVAAPSVQQGYQLATLLGSDGAKVDFSHSDASTAIKPPPALANGMIAQLNAVQQTEKGQAATTNGPAATGLTDSPAISGNTPTQTAIAIAATPAIQPVADEQRPKLAAPTDNLVINAPAPVSNGPMHNAAAADQPAPTKPAMPTPPVFDQVAVHIAKAAAEGSDKINIKLKPATLGQIEVHLEVASDGRVHAVIAADKPETLDLLQRDARSLEQALSGAGLRTDSGSLSFNLRGQGQHYGNAADYAGGGYSRAPDHAGSNVALLADAARIGAYVNSRAAAGGVDIRV